MQVPALKQKHKQSPPIVILKAVCRFVFLHLCTFSGFSIFSTGFAFAFAFAFAFGNFARYCVVLLNAPSSDRDKKTKRVSNGLLFPGLWPIVFDARKSRCPIGLQFQEAG